MGRKRKLVAPAIPGSIEKWEVQTELQINGRNVSRGTELKIRGQRGRFRFIKYVKTETTDWVDVWGGPRHSENWRSFRLADVVRVHAKNQTYQNLAVEYKDKKKAMKQEVENETA